MEKFQNVTANNKEKSIKIGNSVPTDGVPISWFATKEISPKNNIVTLDLSETIPENTPNLSSDNEAFFAVSEELGFLKTVDNKFSFSTDQLTISNIPLHKQMGTDYYDLSTENPNDFAHYYYVSRYFIPAPSNFFYTGLDQYLDPDKLGNLKIKVLDSNGLDYIDQNTGRKKYRILLEPFVTSANRLRYEIPHRVIVLLDASEPISLKLNYDKIQSDQDGNMFHLELNYLETINALPIFQEIPEEAFVIDPNYSNKKNFSIKKINQKYSDLIENTKLDTGYQVIAPGKPVDDNRTFEAFNWRLIARTNRSVNFSQINDQIGSQLINKTIKAGIIYSSNSNQTNSSIYPYVFHRLQQSPFNLSQFNFINPLQEPGYGNNANDYSKTEASYWKVDIDSVTTLDDFDILLWSPDATITQTQALKLKSFVNKNGTLLIDSSYLSISMTALSPQLSMSLNRISAQYEFDGSASTTLYDNTYNGGWTIVPGIFEKEEYGIFGSRYNFNTSAYKQYYYFDNVSDSGNVLSFGASENGTGSEPVCVHLKMVPETDALVGGNIIALTTRLMSYCNSIYSIASSEQVVNSNTGDTYADINESNYYSSILEGPFKFLYNIICYTAYCRLQASRETRTNSSLYNFVTNWNSSWVMDSNVLWEDEIDQFFTPISISGGVDVYARRLSSSAILDFYKDQFSAFMESHHQDVAFGDLTDIELFIESTNNDVVFTNCENVTSADANINSSYNLFQVLNNNETVYAYATTSKTSPSLTVPEGIGPYTVQAKQYSSSNSKLLKNDLNILSNFKTYPFSLQTKYTYLTATDKPSIIDVDFSPTAQMLFKGTLTEQRSVTVDEPESTQLVDATLNCENFKSAIDDLGLMRETVSSKPTNIFQYSGDIDIHKDTRLWKTPYTHEYVKYIQYTVSAANNSAIKIDGIYGPQTTAAVLAFQKANNERYLDGTVDSETKSYMARYWKNLKLTNLTKYRQLRTAASSDPNTSVVVKYIDAVDSIGSTSEINTKTYKKLTFSGFSGPGEGVDIIYFKIPNTVRRVNKIIIEADSNPVWRNFNIVQVGYSSTYSTDIFKYTVNAVNKMATTGTIEIPFNNIAGSNARYMWIHVIAKSLTGYGYAEGFSIKSVKVFGKVAVTTDPDPVTSIETVTSDIYALATVNLEDSFSGVSPSSSKIKQYTTSSFPRAGASISALTIDAALDGSIPASGILANGPVTVNPSLLTDISLVENSDSLFLNNKVKINFSNAPILVWLNSISVDSFSNNGLAITSGTPVNVSYANASDKKSTTITAQTSSTYYSDSVFIQVGPASVGSYKLQKPSGTPLPGTRNAVTASDGVMLLCNVDGQPVGLLDSLNIQNGITGISTPDMEEINTALGDFSVINLLGDQDGFMYGFYDRNRLEFIGKTISYAELMSRGMNNVFVAVCAYDADGNTQNQSEYIGPVSDTLFVAPRIPLKTIYPIYSVKLKRASSIRVDKIDQNISKFDIWNLPISAGSFWKDITIRSRPWTDWKSDYIGQTLKAFYTTFDDLIEEGSTGFESTGTVWSEIYGYGHYDVKDESPVILDDRTIQLRRTPILKIAYPTSNLSSNTGVIKHELHVFTRETTSSSWVEVSEDFIRDIDGATGIVKFRTRLVPSDKNLIKVNYVTENKNRMIHQLNGEMIPLNPLFSSLMTFDSGSKATFDVPLYIYLKPKAIYKQQILPTAINITDVNLTKINEYTCEKTLGFTYNSALFNQNVSEYDPFALLIAIVYVTNNPYRIEPNLYDIRTRGGGVDVDIPTSTLIESVPEVLSNWDVYPPSGMAYARGGYVIIKIPASVKDHFLNEKEIYQIISNNLTAGVAYELQDMDGNSWN